MEGSYRHRAPLDVPTFQSVNPVLKKHISSLEIVKVSQVQERYLHGFFPNSHWTLPENTVCMFLLSASGGCFAVEGEVPSELLVLIFYLYSLWLFRVVVTVSLCCLGFFFFSFLFFPSKHNHIAVYISDSLVYSVL